MEIMNLKPSDVTLICRFPPAPNTKLFGFGFFYRGFQVANRNKFWIGFTLVVTYVFAEMIQYRLSLGPLNPVSIEQVFEAIGFILLIGFGFLIVLLAGLNFGRSGPSGTTRLTRPTSESVDGFGGARARDFSHSMSGYGSKGGLPVSLRSERKRTATFREGAKEYDDEDERSE
ncbi:MAG: hypothetical protein ACTSV2_09020 [Candidatus Thorarchaeota archaeon]